MSPQPPIDVDRRGPRIVELFLEHARDHPGADAVVTPERRTTYGALRRSAGRLQRRLDGIPGSGPVAVLARDAVDRATAALATIAAGRAFVLLDPHREAASILAAAKPLAARIAIGDTVPGGFTHHLSPGDVDDAPGDTDLHPLAVGDDHPHLYVATSGSTGEPRYVLRTSAAALHPRGSDVDLGPDDRSFRPFNHSGPSLASLLEALTAGATFLSVDPLRLPPSAILDFLQEERTTVIRATPTVLRLLFGATSRRTDVPLPGLRSVGGGGEPMLWSDVPSLRALGPPGCVVRHGYASTETRAVTRRVVTASEPLGNGAVPAGRPVPGRRVWIDAGDGRPAGPGHVGTIVVEGRFGTVGPTFERLADGMLRFRTGDLGELTEDGELLHRGRSDGVVKVAAVRIDTAAVESALRTVDGVRDVRVLPTAVGGGVRLVAHVHVAEGTDLDAGSLRRHAGRLLVSNAVPARFVVHDAPFPLLASGKTDLVTLNAHSGPEGRSDARSTS